MLQTNSLMTYALILLVYLSVVSAGNKLRKVHDSSGSATYNTALEDSITTKEKFGKVDEYLKWMLSDANYYHHNLMSAVIPVLKTSHPDATWLTIGDSRLCYESAYIKQMSKTLQTSISVRGSAVRNGTCEETLKAGLIDSFSALNAESIDLEDNSFDFVITKESFHHFIHPYMGLYEMLRVAKHGLILIEPGESSREKFESNIGKDEKSENLAKSILRRPIRTIFERVGFQFNVDPTDFRKIALALGHKYIAFQGNNCPSGTKSKEEFFATRDRLNELGQQGKRRYNLITTIFFKQDPPPAMLQALEAENYLVLQLPQSASDMQHIV